MKQHFSNTPILELLDKMRIALAQVRCDSGQLRLNLQRHVRLIHAARRHQADLVLFPELSLSGYEPRSANSLAKECQSHSLNELQTLCDRHHLAVCVGMPLPTATLPTISAIQFRPHAPRRVFSKCFLHADELPYFSSGECCLARLSEQPRVTLAICYELSVPDHANSAKEAGSIAYAASVAKTEQNVDAAQQRLSSVAKSMEMMTMLCNSIGRQDGAMCVGRSAVWDRDGKRIVELPNDTEGLIVTDIDCDEVVAIASEADLDT